jgi:hypothetical protein
MRVRCLGHASFVAALRRAAAGVGSATGAVEILDAEATADYDAVCLLEPPATPDTFGTAAGVWHELLTDARAGKHVLLAGPTPSLETAQKLAAGCTPSGAALFGAGLPSHSPWGKAAAAAGEGRSLGAPVYLRYTAEAGSSSALFWHATGAIELAAQTLGAPVSVYAATVTNAAGAPVHLALSVKLADDSVALLGVGALESEAGATGERRGKPALLYLGDRGALETNAAAGGMVYRDEPAGPPLATLRDDREDTLTSWLRAAIEATRTGPRKAARHTLWLAAIAEAVQRSSLTGKPESIPHESV